MNTSNTEGLEEFLTSLKNKQKQIYDSEYYSSMRQLAQLIRQKYDIQTIKINLNLIRAIYRQEDIRIDIWPKNRFKKLRALYCCNDDDYSVLVADLPREPKLFALVHELKHHYVDQDEITVLCRDVTDKSSRIEKGADIFTSEFIFPISEFKQLLLKLGVNCNNFLPKDVCRIKHTCKVPVSYQFICRYLYFFKITPYKSLYSIQFTKLYEEIYGEPDYKRIQRYRKMRA